MSLLQFLSENKANFHGIDIFQDIHCKYSIKSLDEPIIISFPPLGTHNSTDISTEDYSIKVWGFDYLKKQNWNVISIGFTGENNYFQSPDFISFLELLSPLLQLFPKRLGYGFSRGGFGVSTFADLLKLSSILLVHPISNKQQVIVPWDTRRSTRDAQLVKWNDKYCDINIPSNCKVFIFYDPCQKIDSLHVNRYRSGDVNKIRIFGMGHHGGIQFLIKNSNLWTKIVSSFVKCDSIPTGYIVKLKFLMKLSPLYYKNVQNGNKSNVRKGLFLSAKNNAIKLASAHKPDVAEAKSKVIDSIRNLAFKVENVDLYLALELMKIALFYRPDGAIIKQKVTDYENTLAEVNKYSSLWYVKIKLFWKVSIKNCDLIVVMREGRALLLTPEKNSLNLKKQKSIDTVKNIALDTAEIDRNISFQLVNIACRYG